MNLLFDYDGRIVFKRDEEGIGDFWLPDFVLKNGPRGSWQLCQALERVFGPKEDEGEWRVSIVIKVEEGRPQGVGR